MVGTAISDYGMLSDRHTAALVSARGSVDWLCFPRFDSPSVFGRLLDEDAGHWRIHPADDFTATREYIDHTLVLRTRFTTGDGELELTDALVLGPPGDPHQLGVGAPHALARTVKCTRGTVAVYLSFCARPEYGLVNPLLSAVEGGMLVRGGATRLLLSTPVGLEWDNGTGTTIFTLHSGQTMSFSLLWSLWGIQKETCWDQKEITERIAMTEESWLVWSRAHESYRGPWKREVDLGGRVLHGLGYQPTGAIVAAVTTSLPESLGGTRNWDYRYTWVRDASFTMDALWVAACPDEAREFFDFVTVASATTRGDDAGLQIMFGIGGEHDLTERELAHLSGWRASSPVRVGNDAWRQKQLDVYGELLDTAARFAGKLTADGVDNDPALRDFLRWTADTVMRVWRQPDQGIWEIQGEPKHFVHSKLMCWVALDRALQLGFDDRAAEWTAARDEIRAAIEEHGYHEDVGAYTQSFGSEQLDAAALMVPIVGFDTGPRAVSTVDAIASRLTDSRGLVYRYSAESNVDGMAEPEGVFLLCTFWLARAYAATGRPAEAREVMERAVAWSNDLGLLAEQVDPATGELMGNFPQAFSHIGLVNAAWAISEAEGSLAA